MATKQKWLDGTWVHSKCMNHIVEVVKGENVTWKIKSSFDYPELELTMPKFIWTYGTFGETIEEIKSLTGASNYNIKVESDYRFYNVKVKHVNITSL